MKLKDIEKKLKEENSQVKVPDVLARVKKAPINRLLTPPAQAFKKRLAIQLLCFAFILILAVMFTLVTMFFVPNAEKTHVVFLKLTVESEEGSVSYGLCMFDDNVQKACVLQQNDEYVMQDLGAVGGDIQTTLNGVYHAKDNDKVSICVIAVDDVDRKKTESIAQSAVAELYSHNLGLTTTFVGASAGKEDLQLFLQSQGVEVTDGENPSSLLQKLNALFC